MLFKSSLGSTRRYHLVCYKIKGYYEGSPPIRCTLCISFCFHMLSTLGCTLYVSPAASQPPAAGRSPASQPPATTRPQVACRPPGGGAARPPAARRRWPAARQADAKCKSWGSIFLDFRTGAKRKVLIPDPSPSAEYGRGVICSVCHNCG